MSLLESYKWHCCHNMLYLTYVYLYFLCRNCHSTLMPHAIFTASERKLAFSSIVKEIVFFNVEKYTQQKINSSVNFSLQVSGFKLVVKTRLIIMCTKFCKEYYCEHYLSKYMFVSVSACGKCLWHLAHFSMLKEACIYNNLAFGSPGLLWYCFLKYSIRAVSVLFQCWMNWSMSVLNLLWLCSSIKIHSVW